MTAQNPPDQSPNSSTGEPRKWSQEWADQRAAEIEAEVAAMPPLAEWTEEQKRHSGLWLLKLVQERFGHIPKEEWADEPEDLSEQLDHYLYGTPKKTPLKYE